MTSQLVPIANDSRGNMEQVITKEELRSMSNDALQRLANDAWHDQATELSWALQAEIVRRKHEAEDLTLYRNCAILIEAGTSLGDQGAHDGGYVGRWKSAQR